ncbi:MAG: hypothetical protein JW981_05920 [Anaerolineae bacterium]|nr:hypothetical protein [Anaerolineae bacterium]
MDIEFLVQRLEEYIFEECPKVFGLRMVNEEAVRNQLAQLREMIPVEIQRAREVIEKQDAILIAARHDAERIVAKSREDMAKKADDHQITQDARHKAGLILQRAEKEAGVLRSDADEYVFDSLSQLQEELTRILQVVENGLRKLEAEKETQIRSQE